MTDLDPTPTETPRKGWLRRNIDLYGWRIYAIPVLAVITILVLVDTVWGGTDSKKDVTPPTVVAAKETGIIGPTANGTFNASTPSYALPDGPPFEVMGDGTWHTVSGKSKQVGGGHVFTYLVEVEDGNDTKALGGDEAFAKLIDDTLANSKGWTKDKKFGFQRIDNGTPDFRISLAAQTTARKICGFENLPVDTSCYDQDNNRIVVTTARWVRGAVAFNGDVTSYREWVINHEVGHAIGFHQHAACDTDGGLAPVMMQQTFGTANNEVYNLDPAGVVPKDGKECKPNEWPYPKV